MPLHGARSAHGLPIFLWQMIRKAGLERPMTKSRFDKSDDVTGCELLPSPRIVNNHAGCDDCDDCDGVQIAVVGMLPEKWNIRV